MLHPLEVEPLGDGSFRGNLSNANANACNANHSRNHAMYLSGKLPCGNEYEGARMR